MWNINSNMHKLFPEKSDRITNTMGTFKQRKSFAVRKEEVESIRSKFPTKIPVIVERYPKESQLPLLDKTKFLVPQELALSQFLTIIRNRMHLGPTQAFYLLINNRSIASMTKTILEVYLESKDEDGFLYVTYASQEMFGLCLQKAIRKEVEKLTLKFPTKIPVIVKRHSEESQLPLLDKSKFLVPEEMSFSMFIMLLRKRMHLEPTQDFCMLVNNRSIGCVASTIREVYLESKAENGLLYVRYASRETFEASSPEVIRQL